MSNENLPILKVNKANSNKSIPILNQFQLLEGQNMKKLWNHTFIRYLLSYALVLFLPLLVLGGVVNFYFTNYYIETSLQKNLDIPRQIQTAVDMQVTQMDNFSIQIGANSNFTARYLNEGITNYMTVVGTLSSFQSSNEFVDNVYYYPGDSNGKYYSRGGTSDPSILFQSINRYENLNVEDFARIAKRGPTWIGSSKVRLPSGQTVSYVTYIRPVYGNFSSKERPFLIFQIQENTFERILGSVGDGDEIYKIITNHEGDIVYSSFSEDRVGTLEELLKNYETDTQKVEAEQWRLGDLDGREVYVNRSESQSGLTYYTLIPTEVMLQDVHNFQRTFSLIYFILVTLGFLLVLFVSRSSYKPVKKLADYMQENGAGVPAGSNIMEMAQMTIQRLSQSSLEYRQEHLLLNLLRDSDTSATDEELQAAKLQLEGPYYRAAILRVKAFPEEEWPQGVRPPELSEYIPLLQQIFSAEKTCYIVEYMERNCFILVFSEKSSDPEECSAYLQKCTNLLNESCLQGFLYVGNAYSTLDLLRQSFHEAKTAFVNRNIRKETTVYFYGIHPSDDSIYQQTYPTADLDALCNAIDQDNPMLVEFMSTELQRHIEHIAGDSFTVRCVCYEAINRIFQTMDKKSPGWMKRACGDIVNNLSISSVEDLKLVLQTLCSQVILDIKAKPERPQKLSMKDATAYIDCHFCDPDFSVKSLAADYKMSVSNFSHQFKTYTGKTVSDYINHKKNQYAKELLRETGGSVAEVASKVGYFHTSSFIRKYKQEEGITPGEYLEQIRNNSNASSGKEKEKKE